MKEMMMNRFNLFCAGVCSGVVVLTALVYTQIRAGDIFDDPNAFQVIGERDAAPDEITFTPEIEALITPLPGGFKVEAQANLLTTEPLDISMMWHVAVYNGTADQVIWKRTYNNESFTIQANEPKLVEFSDGYTLEPGSYVVFVALRQVDADDPDGKSLVGQSYDLTVSP